MSKNLQSSTIQNKSLWLILLGVLSCVLYAGIYWQSRYFVYDIHEAPPIPVILSLFGITFVVYLISVFVAVRAKQQLSTTTIIWGFAIGFRLLLLFSEPILEIDIYRYLWDGRVMTAGVSPYQYSPQQLLKAEQNQTHPNDLQKLITIREASPVTEKILKRIHYGELTSVYPPVSQMVFAAAQSVTPQNASVVTHLIVMKCFIVLFDLTTIFLLIKTVQLTGKPIGWVVAYAWSPLILKEFANSGHLDAIAVCLTTAAIYFVIKLFSLSSKRTYVVVIVASVMLALAVGAKLYPVVLFPLMWVAIWRQVSFRSACLFGLLFFAVVVPVCWQMVPSKQFTGETTVVKTSPATSPDVYEEILPPVPPGGEQPSRPVLVTPPLHQQAEAGLKQFLSTWEMNDLFFMLISENLSPDGSEGNPHVWFVISSSQMRSKWVEQLATVSNVQPQRVPFMFARLMTTAIFLVIVMFQAFPTQKTATTENFLQAAFLTLAWFWLLLPTQNPWYWIWAMPLLPFAKNRAWLILSGLVFVYYLRFWFNHHFENELIWGTPYAGVQFFDYVVVWFEYVPLFVLLVVYRALSRKFTF